MADTLDGVERHVKNLQFIPAHLWASPSESRLAISGQSGEICEDEELVFGDQPEVKAPE
jgi:hypothetical protein